MNPKYLLITFAVVIILLSLLLSNGGAFQLKQDEVVYPQINMSFSSSSDVSNAIILKVAESIVRLDFSKKSSISDSKHTKRWTEKGMVEVLWSRNDKDFVSVDNLLNQGCYNLRVFTMQGKGDAENVSGIILKELEKYLGKLKVHNNLNCK